MQQTSDLEKSNSRERLILKPLSLNLNLPIHSSNSKAANPLEHLIQSRPTPLTSARQNKTASLKTIAELKQILSKSLFHKKPPLECSIKQNPKDDLGCRKSDSKPISPESHQKQVKPPIKAFPSPSPQIFEENDAENLTSRTSQLLDLQFNNLLDMNLSHQQELGLEIQSKFTSKKSQSIEKEEVELLQSSNSEFQHIAAHQKLLEEENAYIREQLIIFTETIDTERIRNHELKHKAKTYHRQNHKLKEKNKVLIEELSDREEKFYNLSVENDERELEVEILRKGKKEMMEKVEELSKECEEIFYKLEHYQSLKEKEIQGIVEEKNKEKDALAYQVSEKEKEIYQLNQFVQQLKQQIINLEQRLNKSEDKVNTSMSDDQFQEKESICLSLAEAESLKHIIQTKENMFQKEIDTLKRKSLIFQSESEKTKEELQQRIRDMEADKQVQDQINSRNMREFMALQQQLEQEIKNLQQKLAEEQSNSMKLTKQATQLQQKCKSIDMEQDEQLEDLLQNCVEQLQKERQTNTILREEIANLKRVFAKEMHYVQQIESKMFFN